MFITLRSKIIAGYGVLIAVHLVFTLWAVNRFSTESSAATGAVGSYSTRSTLLLQLSSSASSALASLVSASSREIPGSYISESQRFGQLLGPGEPSGDSLYDASFRSIVRAHDSFDSAVTATFGDGRNLLSTDIRDQYEDLVESIERAGRASTLLLANQRSELSDSIRDTLATITLASLVAGIIGVLAGIIYARWALQSIERLRTAVRHVSKGEFSQKIHITTADELGDLSFDFNRMIEQLHAYQAMNVESILLERRKAETVVKSIVSPILVVDDNGVILLANSAARRLFGNSIESSFEGRDVREVVSDQDILKRLSEVEVSAGGRVERFAYSVEREGEERFYSVSLHSIAGQSGESPAESRPAGVIMLLTDVTEFKALDSMKSDILARVSHELRTPLSSVLMGADLLKEGVLGELSDRQLEMISEMKQDLKRLSTMTDEILRAARLEGLDAGGEVPRERLVPILEEALSRHYHLASDRGVEFSQQVSINDDWVFPIHPEHLRLILDNLVSNAVRFAGDDGCVSVSIEGDQSGLRIAVSDNGPGIPLSEQERIFERFYQIDRGYPNPAGSIGLGLSLVAEVVSRYRGAISVESVEKQGATFRIDLPNPGGQTDE